MTPVGVEHGGKFYVDRKVGGLTGIHFHIHERLPLLALIMDGIFIAFAAEQPAGWPQRRAPAREARISFGTYGEWSEERGQ